MVVRQIQSTCKCQGVIPLTEHIRWNDDSLFCSLQFCEPIRTQVQAVERDGNRRPFYIQERACSCFDLYPVFFANQPALGDRNVKRLITDQSKKLNGLLIVKGL